MPNKGIPKIAPQTPPNFAPTTKDIKTRDGDKPMNLLLRIGVKIFPSICWIKIKMPTAKTAFIGLVKTRRAKMKMPIINGPTNGIKLEKKAKIPKEKG